MRIRKSYIPNCSASAMELVVGLRTALEEFFKLAELALSFRAGKVEVTEKRGDRYETLHKGTVIEPSYDWGWTIVMFIEKTFGKEMILRIVRECDNGDILGIIGEDLKDFEKRWEKWLLGHSSVVINHYAESKKADS